MSRNIVGKYVVALAIRRIYLNCFFIFISRILVIISALFPFSSLVHDSFRFYEVIIIIHRYELRHLRENKNEMVSIVLCRKHLLRRWRYFQLVSSVCTFVLECASFVSTIRRNAKKINNCEYSVENTIE